MAYLAWAMFLQIEDTGPAAGSSGDRPGIPYKPRVWTLWTELRSSCNVVPVICAQQMFIQGVHYKMLYLYVLKLTKIILCPGQSLYYLKYTDTHIAETNVTRGDNLKLGTNMFLSTP